MNSIEKILNLMNKNNITAKKLTEEAKLPASSITEWKKNKAKPSAEAITKIADYFNVTTDYLLGKSDNPHPIQTDVTFDDFTFALYNETKDLTETDKEELLEAARMFNRQRLERKEKLGLE